MRAEGKLVSQGNTHFLADQLSKQEMARQVPVEVQDPWSVGGDRPEESCKENNFQSWKEKSGPFHADIIMSGTYVLDFETMIFLVIGVK